MLRRAFDAQRRPSVACVSWARHRKGRCRRQRESMAKRLQFQTCETTRAPSYRRDPDRDKVLRSRVRASCWWVDCATPAWRHLATADCVGRVRHPTDRITHWVRFRTLTPGAAFAGLHGSTCFYFREPTSAVEQRQHFRGEPGGILLVQVTAGTLCHQNDTSEGRVQLDDFLKALGAL